MIFKSYPFMGILATDASHLPTPPLAAFFGREKLIETVSRQLAANAVALLHGPEGIGKTAIASALAALRIRQQGSLVWMNAGLDDLGALCDQVGQAYDVRGILDAPNPEAQIARTQSTFAKHKPMLVIDNVHNAQAVREFIRKTAGDLPVVALADEPFAGPWTPIAVEGLNRPAATALFYHHSGLVAGGHADDVDRLCALLEDHPLAIEVVARLAALVKLGPGELLAALPSAAAGAADSIQGALQATFERLTPGGQALILVLGATFAGGGTPETLGVIADLSAEYVQKAVTRLEDRGLGRLVTVDGRPYLTAHPAVYRFARALLERMDRLASAEERAVIALADYGTRHAGDDAALHAEWGNLQGALAWAVRAGDVHKVGVISEALASSALLSIHGHARLREQLAAIGVAPAPVPATAVETAAAPPSVAHSETDWPGGALVREGDTYLATDELESAEAAYSKALGIAHETGDLFMEGRLLDRLGQVCEASGRYDQAAEYYRQAAIAAHRAQDTATEGVAMANMGAAFAHLGRVDHTIAAYQRAIPLLQKASQTTQLVQAYNDLGLVLAEQGRLDEAHEAHQQALEIARAAEDHAGECDALLCLGDVNRRARQFELAIGAYRQALERSRALGDRQTEERALGAIGIASLNLSEPDSAADYLARALTVSQELGEVGHERDWIGYLATAYQELGDDDKAMAACRRAIELARRAQDRQSEAGYLNSLGLILARQGRFDEAIEHYRQALSIAQVIRARADEAGFLNNIGLAYMEEGEAETAIVHYQQSLEIRRELGDRQGEAHALGNIGVAYGRMANWEAALRQHTQALDIARMLGDLYDQSRQLGNIGLANEALGQREAAIQAYKEALDIAYQIGDTDGRAALLFLLGSLLMDEVPYLAEAVSMLEESYAIRLNRDRALVPETLRRLNRARKRLERAQKAGLAIRPAATAEERQAASRDGARRGAIRRAAASAARQVGGTTSPSPSEETTADLPADLPG